MTPKTISLETSKIIEDELRDVETEYRYLDLFGDDDYHLSESRHSGTGEASAVKTLTEYEAIKLFDLRVLTVIRWGQYRAESDKIARHTNNFLSVEYGETPIEAIDNLIVYLKTNNLLPNK